MRSHQTTTYLLLLAIILLAFALRIYRLQAQSLWWDEMYTAVQASMTPAELLASLFEDRVHTPLYFFLIRTWALVDQSPFFIRYFSVVTGLLAVPLIYVSGRRLDGRAVGLVAAILLTIAPFHIWFSQEARMYSFLALNALAANYFLLRLLHRERRRDWAAYTVTLTFTLYTHYLGGLILIAHYFFFSLHYRQNPARFRRWFVSGSVAGVLYLTWFLAVFFVSSFADASISWIAPVRWYEPLITLLSFSVGPTVDPTTYLPYVAFLTYLLGAIAAYWFAGRQTEAQSTNRQLSWRLIWFWLSVPFLLLTLISIDWSIPDQRYIYMDRYLISLLPAFVLLAAWGFVTLDRQVWSPRWVLPLLLMLILLPTVNSWHNLYFNPDYAREDWRAAVGQLRDEWKANDVILLDPSLLLPLHHYSSAALDLEITPFLPDEVERERYLSQEMPLRTAAIQTRTARLWHIAVAENSNPHGFPHHRNQQVAAGYPHDPYAAWLDRHYPVAVQFQFTGLRLTLYNLDTNLSQ
jgi:mannosyltransferase